MIEKILRQICSLFAWMPHSTSCHHHTSGESHTTVHQLVNPLLFWWSMMFLVFHGDGFFSQAEILNQILEANLMILISCFSTWFDASVHEIMFNISVHEITVIPDWLQKNLNPYVAPKWIWRQTLWENWRPLMHSNLRAWWFFKEEWGTIKWYLGRPMRKLWCQ